jgi:PAS domain S-box-containing protein
MHNLGLSSQLAMLEKIKDILLAEVAPEAILIIDSTSKILYVNAAFEQLFGYTREEAIGSNISIIQSKELASAHVIGLNRYLKTGVKKLDWQSTRTRGLSKHKTDFPIEIRFSHVRVDGSDYFAAFIKDITGIVAQEKQISSQNEELKKKNQELDNFAYRVSHDLRAPLLSVLGLVNVYRLSDDREQQKSIINKIEKSVEKLDLFIKQIINLSKNERIEPTFQEVNMADLFHEVLEDLGYMDAFENIEKRVNVLVKAPLLIDGFRLKMICMNLISNAIRYHNQYVENPYVSLTAEQTDKNLHLKVTDNGIGMSKETREKIFDMYYRGSDRSSGSGLGMYIVKEMVTRLGGQITIESELGKGSSIEITVPLRLANP